MNRIYQGKVTKLEIRNAAGEWEKLEGWQDAINYCSLAPAALA